MLMFLVRDEKSVVVDSCVKKVELWEPSQRVNGASGSIKRWPGMSGRNTRSPSNIIKYKKNYPT